MTRQQGIQLTATIGKLGINPCVTVPAGVVSELRRGSGKVSGPLPVRGRVGRTRFIATVVRYAGAWRLYLNTAIRVAAAVDVGDRVVIVLAYDPVPRRLSIPARLATILKRDAKTRTAWTRLTPSRRRDIVNYLNSLKTKESLERNVRKATAEIRREPASRRAPS